MVDINTKFGALLTKHGAAKKTNCDALGLPWKLTQMLLGDGGGENKVPNADQTALVREVYRAQLNALYVSPTDANVLVAEIIVPPDIGGWWIRELALEDDAGVFSAVGNCAPSYKPALAQGAGRNQIIRMHIITHGTNNIQLKIDPSVVLATRSFVEAEVLVVSNALKAHVEAPNPHSQYAKAADVAQSQAAHIAASQFLPWDAARTYRTGETCTQLVDGELKTWEMYAGPNLTCKGKDPSSPANRHEGWVSTTAPFWWIEQGNRPGTPHYWLAETAPAHAVMELGLDLSIAVYWRLARRYPHLVNTLAGTINTGEIRGEFLRVWDGGRGVDPARALLSGQLQDYQAHTHPADIEYRDGAAGNGGPLRIVVNDTLTPVSPFDNHMGTVKMSGGSETRPRNVARAMVIEV
ncbi:MAG: phage tail protein [Candidatus Oceanisphaera merdipullorum]|nr:phage tail protein [Candidatus Oceanisphaera merdipullorum]